MADTVVRERLDMDDGQWATFRTSFTWGPANRIRAAMMDVEDGRSTIAAFYVVVREVCLSWHVLSGAGAWLDALDDESLEGVNDPIGQRVLTQCMTNWRMAEKGRDPKGSAVKLSDSPPASG